MWYSSAQPRRTIVSKIKLKSITMEDEEPYVTSTWTIMMLRVIFRICIKLCVRCLDSQVEQLYKALENNIYEGLMRLSTKVDEELCVMIT